MAKVEVTIDEVTLEDEHGREREGVMAECSKCEHITESYGTSEASKRRCLALMREQCPMGEENFYVVDDG